MRYRTEDGRELIYGALTELKSVELPDFVLKLEAISDETPVAWKDERNIMVHPGIWLRSGTYKLKHGSFVDPSDLACYGAQFYVADEKGRHTCLQIGHGLEGPEDAVAISTVGELRDALAVYLPASSEEEELIEDGSAEVLEEDCQPNDAESKHQEAPSTMDCSADCEYQLLQPDGAFEMHGSLTKGWNAALMRIDYGEDGVEEILLFD